MDLDLLTMALEDILSHRSGLPQGTLHPTMLCLVHRSQKSHLEEDAHAAAPQWRRHVR